MLQLTRPRYFVPIHGEYRQLSRHTELARAVGIPAENCFLLENGQVLELGQDSAQRGETVAAGKVFVDGKGIGDVEDIVIRDRRHLSEDGMVVVVMTLLMAFSLPSSSQATKRPSVMSSTTSIGAVRRCTTSDPLASTCQVMRVRRSSRPCSS